MKKAMILLVALMALTPIEAKKVKKAVQTDREYWCELAYKMAQPVLENMAKGELQKNMKTEFSPSFDNRNRKVVYMETFGRLMAGVAPWLGLTPSPSPTGEGSEYSQVMKLREWALQAYKNAVDPESPDYLCWGAAGQNLVDAAYIAESFIRAYDALWVPLDDVTKQRYITEFKKLRSIEPPYTNWFLFSSIIESFIAKASGLKEYDDFRVMMTIRKVEEWYIGDGWYADGPVFAFDYSGALYLTRGYFPSYRPFNALPYGCHAAPGPDGVVPEVAEGTVERTGTCRPDCRASSYVRPATELQRRRLPDHRLLWPPARDRRLVYQQRFALHDFVGVHAVRPSCRPSVLDGRCRALDTGEGLGWPALPERSSLGRRYPDEGSLVSGWWIVDSGWWIVDGG